MYEKLLRKFLSLKQFLKIDKLKVLILLVVILIIHIALLFSPNNKTFGFIDITTKVFFAIILITILYIKSQQNKTFKKLWRKNCTITYRQFLRRDRFEQYAITLIFLTGIIAFIFIFSNKIFSLFISYAVMMLIAFFGGYKQWKKCEYEKEKLFGNDYKNKSDNNIISILTNEMYKLFGKFVILPVACVIIFMSIYIYRPIFDKVIISEKPNDWGALGSYIGIILTILTITATMGMIYMQQKQINKSTEEFRKEQFRITTFEYLLKKIEKYMDDIKNEETTKQIYQLLKIISQEIYEYSNKNSNIQNKYIFILKTYFNNSILKKIFTDENILHCDENNNNNLYTNIKNIIDKYSFFKDLYLPDIDEAEIGLDNPTYLTNKDAYFKKYKISAFEGNDELMSYRIDLEEDDKAFDEYAEHHSIKVRQSVAKNKFTSIKTLKFLSEDEKAEVRQEVAFNKNTPENILEQLSNDNEKEVRVTALGNSNISQQTLKNELEKKYNKLNKDNIKEIIYIIFNNSKVYDIDKIFNQYITSVIAFMQQQSDKREYEIREIFPCYMREIEYKHITKKIFIKSIENILDNKYQTFCYYILLFYRALCHNNIMTYHDNIYSIIYDKQKMVSDLSTEKKLKECKEKISSIFKEHETELREFIEQLKND